MIFESHAHYDDEAFHDDRDELLKELLSKNISHIINVWASVESSRASIALAEKYEQVYAAIGVHPSEAYELNDASYALLKDLAKHPKAVAIGEIGLDYYWEKDENAQKLQQHWFSRQMELARELGLPVIIHSRDAAEDTMCVMQECRAQEIPGVVHCYSYSPELAKEFVRLGYYIGVGGVVTFKNSKKLKETVQQIPLERILLETDCPYMAPEPFRGKRNNSAYLHYVADKIAELRGITAEEVEQVTWENAMRLFTRIK